MPMLSKREGLARKVDTAAIEAESLGLTTATLILRMARLEIDRAEPDEVEIMPRNNRLSKLGRQPKSGQLTGFGHGWRWITSRF